MLYIAQITGEILDLIGVFVILTGVILAIIVVIYEFFKDKDSDKLYRDFRKNLGRSILLGLEFLVAGDVIRSVTGEPSFTSITVLVVVVIVRSFLSIIFDMEIEGHWPWQKGKKVL